MLRNIFLLSTLFILLSFCTASCEYELSEINLVEVSREPKVKLNLSSLSSIDTLEIYNSTRFQYNFEVSSGSFYELNVFLNEEEIHSSNINYGDFFISSAELPTGIYEMRFEIYTSTGTKSLADKSGVEQLFFEKKIKVIFDNDPLHKPEGLSVQKNEKGHLVIKWNKNKRNNFRKYIIYKRFEDEEWPYYYSLNNEYEVFEFENANDTIFIDSTYFGNKHYYQVLYESLSNEKSAYAEAEYFEPTPSLISFTSIEGNKLKLTWNKSLYPSLFSSYVIKLFKNKEILFQTTNLSDTFTIIEKPVDFGGPFRIELATIPVSATEEEIAGEKYSKSSEIHFGEKVKPYENIIFDKDGHHYIISNYSLFKLNEQLNPIDSLSEPNFWGSKITISNDGKDIYYWYNENIEIIDAENLEVRKQLNLNQLLGSNKWRSIHSLAIQDNKDLYIGYAEHSSFVQGTLYFSYYNAQEETLYPITTEPFTITNLKAGSVQGHLVGHYLGKTVGIKMERESIVELIELDQTQKQIQVNPTEPHKFILINEHSPTLEIWQFDNFTKESEFELPEDTYSLNLNYHNNILSIVKKEGNENYLYLIERSSGQTIMKLDLWESIYNSYPATHKLYNNWIYASSGFKIDVQNLVQ